MDENSMLLLRYSSYKKYDFIREHNSIIKNKGSVWMLKVEKCIPENKLQKMYEYGGVMYLRSPKIEGEKFYKAIIKAYYSGEPKRNMIFPKYYDEMLNDEDLWLVDSLSGTWFEIVEIKEISKTQAERLKLVSNGKRAVDVLSCTRSSMLYVNE